MQNKREIMQSLRRKLPELKKKCIGQKERPIRVTGKALKNKKENGWNTEIGYSII